MTLTELYVTAESYELDVDYFPMREVASCSMPQGYIAIDTRKIQGTADEKVCLGHELGHCITGSFYSIYTMLDIRGKHEYRANKWAYEHLLPYDDLMQAVDEGLTEVWELAEYFGLPEEFTEKAIEYYKEQELARR